MSSQKPIVLENRGFRVFANEFKGDLKIHIRKQLEDPVSGKTFPTKCGITLSLEEWEGLQSNAGAVNAELYILAKQATENRDITTRISRMQDA